MGRYKEFIQSAEERDKKIKMWENKKHLGR